MNDDFQETLRLVTAAEEIFHLEDIQSLWSGYGKIMRYGLRGADRETVIVKHVKLPDQAHHPRGWNTDLSHQRKIKSYQVESNWYRDWANQCDESCRVPQCLALEYDDDEFLMVLEDLDVNGYPLRKETVSMPQLHACLNWLANFHARFMRQSPAGLWDIGTYWHLATRPDELAAMKACDLKQFAAQLDARLNSAEYQTFVHGDAKLANFCFSEDGLKIAAVDFQYVGGGCGMKDVAYFIGSCLYEADCERHEAELLQVYFAALKQALLARKSTIDFALLEKEWRDLYPLVWTDFHRFLKGWSPGHWKINSYSERLASEVIARIKQAAG